VVLNAPHRPLRVVNPEHTTLALLAPLSATDKNERIVVQWVLGPARSPRPVAASTTAASIEPWWRSLLGGGQAELDPERRQALQTKRADHGFVCIGRVAIAASSPSRRRALAVAVLSGLRLAEAPGAGLRLVKDRRERFNRVSLP